MQGLSKINGQERKYNRHKKQLSIIKKGSIHQEDIDIIIFDAPNSRALKLIKQN